MPRKSRNLTGCVFPDCFSCPYNDCISHATVQANDEELRAYSDYFLYGKKLPEWLIDKKV